MLKYKNKEVSEPVAISIICILTILVGAITLGQCSGVKNEETESKRTKAIQREEVKTSNKFLEIISPLPYQGIKSPIEVTGKSNFNEANTRIRIKDKNGKILADTFSTAQGWIDRLYPFSSDVFYQQPSSKEGIIEIFEESAKDGSEIKKIIIPVFFENYTGESLKPPTVSPGSDPVNSTYIVEGEAIKLKNGYAEQEIIPGAATKIKIKIFGEPITGDLNGDGIKDAVVLLTYDPGGSGTFYYIAAAIKDKLGYKGTKALLLGDRIAPKDIHLENGLILCNYADRAPDQPFSIPPSIWKTKYFQVQNGILKEK